MSKEKSMVLKMLAKGKITPEEAVKLISALGEEPALEEADAQASAAETPPAPIDEWDQGKGNQGVRDQDEEDQGEGDNAGRDQFHARHRRWYHLRPRFPDPSAPSTLAPLGTRNEVTFRCSVCPLTAALRLCEPSANSPWSP